MATWTLRRAIPKDAQALSHCFAAAYADDLARLADLPAGAEITAEEIASAEVWLAEIGGRPVGGLVLYPETDALRLANLAVHPDHRGAGLGRALIAHAERQALDQGHGVLRLTTHVAMTGPRRLYARLGWREEGRDGPKVFMSKAL